MQIWGRAALWLTYFLSSTQAFLGPQQGDLIHPLDPETQLYYQQTQAAISRLPLEPQQKTALLNLIPSIRLEERSTIIPAWIECLNSVPESAFSSPIIHNIAGSLIVYPLALAQIPSSLRIPLTECLTRLLDSYYLGIDSCLLNFYALVLLAPEDKRTEWLTFLEKHLEDYHQSMELYNTLQSFQETQRHERIREFCQVLEEPTPYDLNEWLVCAPYDFKPEGS